MIYRFSTDALTSLQSQWEALERACPAPFANIVILGRGTVIAVIADTRVVIEDALARVRPHPAPATILTETQRACTTASENLNALVTGFFGTPLPETIDPDAAQQCRGILDSIEALLNQTLEDLAEIMTPEGQASSLFGIRSAVDNIASYPILTSGTDYSAGGGAGGTYGSEPAIQGQVESALRSVLGRVPRTSDSKALVAALTQSFEVKDVEGHTEVRWVERAYSGVSELGGRISGAQLSLTTRAGDSARRARELLAGLYPLNPDYDQEETEASRSLVSENLRYLVDELSREGGPLIAKVDSLFAALLGDQNTPGQIARLGEVFGLDEGHVITLGEELNATNFRTFRDIVEDIQVGWERFRDTEYGTDLGTRFVLLSRTLGVANSTVYEVYRTMDSVFVEQPARQVSYFMHRGRRVLLQDFLSWIDDFTAQHARSLVTDGGRRGVEAMAPMVDQLDDLLGGLIQAVPQDPGLPPALRHPRVRPVLQELRGYLGQIRILIQQLAQADPFDPIRRAAGVGGI